jgi:hypothetical protein
MDRPLYLNGKVNNIFFDRVFPERKFARHRDEDKDGFSSLSHALT